MRAHEVGRRAWAFDRKTAAVDKTRHHDAAALSTKCSLTRRSSVARRSAPEARFAAAARPATTTPAAAASGSESAASAGCQAKSVVGTGAVAARARVAAAFLEALGAFVLLPFFVVFCLCLCRWRGVYPLQLLSASMAFGCSTACRITPLTGGSTSMTRAELAALAC